ncbi:MAG: hypothetical protein DSZ05_06085 [Sulfurospirillum sp.]|nr:MAG: hypothetical protein DSZ05_06085 [Sulfurospirillum sp.]
MLFDLDRGFRYASNEVLGYVADDDETSTVFRNLLKNAKFRKLFASRYYTHLNTTFQTERMNQFITEAKEAMQDEIPRHFQRWPKNKDGEDVSPSTWISFMNSMYDFSENRKSFVIAALQNEFHLNGNRNLKIDAPVNGTIYIDGVKLTKNYSGHYFDTATVTLKAIPKQGYRFVKWSNGMTDQTTTVTLNSDLNIEAQFEAAQIPKITITEINYDSDKNHDSGDWIELYNNSNTTVDLSGWSIKDDKDTDPFIIPDNILLQPKSYLVITQNGADFKANFPDVQNNIGDFLFGLGKKGDSVRVFNAQGLLVDSVTFNKSWPDAKGNGKTLSLIDPDSDNSISTNWVAADNFGTPGEQN